jgi:hypothetical protein
MTIKEKFVQQLNNCERIELSSFHRKRKRLLFGILLSLVLIHCSIAVNLYPSIFPLFVVLCSFFVLTRLVLSVYKSISCAVIKGDSLILKNAQNDNCVTSIWSIRKMKVRRIGNTTITFIQFRLDGSKRKALILSENSGLIEPIEAIQSAQKLFKK